MNLYTLGYFGRAPKRHEHLVARRRDAVQRGGLAGGELSEQVLLCCACEGAAGRGVSYLLPFCAATHRTICGPSDGLGDRQLTTLDNRLKGLQPG